MKTYPESHVPDVTGTYDRAFLRTILCLDGVTGIPTAAQLASAKCTVAAYGARLSEAMKLDLAAEPGWLQGRMPEQVAIEHAFVFVRYGSVLNSTVSQSEALRHWMSSPGSSSYIRSFACS